MKLEVTVDEPILLSATVRPVIHGYGEELTGAVRAYSLEEIVAEKLRALLQNEARRGEQGWVRTPRSTRVTSRTTHQWRDVGPGLRF